MSDVLASGTPPRRGVRTVLTIAAVLAVAGAAALAVVATADAATIDTSAYYQLVNRHSGKALEIDNASTADGGALVQRTPNTAATNQQFQFVDSGGGYYRLRARHSGKVLDVYERSTANGANIVQWADLYGPNQQFSIQDIDATYLQLINRNSGKALDLWEWSTAEGARISQYDDTNATNQQFRLVRVGGTTPSPTSSAGTPPAQYSAPGPVAGDVGTHDPSVVKKPPPRTPSAGFRRSAAGEKPTAGRPVRSRGPSPRRLRVSGAVAQKSSRLTIN
ncbi:RICIN domain-containing protein [Catellatospora tritici]|uniref:RICIN domain-containing protein n=1 Tax=Catellatospora tritici TaxID=2851566 RepID=UPI001C2DAFB1|nr:RICIN domain-containing protein [Catellatospora tritici]MBV1850558.1 RICIN domain-containing protein [Catellatospora tritici]